MSAHTPGPWSVHPFYPGHVVPSTHLSRKVGGARNPEVDLREYAQVIVWVDPVHRHRERAEQIANARLIASAPELLTAAIEAYDAMRNIWSTKGRDDDFIYDEMGSELSAGFFSLRAAIAKAKGQP